MLVLTALTWAYAGLYVVGGAIWIACTGAESALAWLVFGLLALVFRSALKAKGRFGRFVAAILASAVAAASALLVIAAPLELWEELARPTTGLMVLAAAMACAGFGWTAQALYRRLAGPTRKSGLITALALPSATTILCAVSAALCLPFTPSGFLTGIVAVVALWWAALAAAFLAGGWLAALTIRAAESSAQPPLPSARVHFPHMPFR